MTSGNGRPLRGPKDVDRVFSDDTIEKLVRDAKLRLLPNTDLNRLCRQICSAVSDYLRDSDQLTGPVEIRRTLSGIARLLKAAKEGNQVAATKAAKHIEECQHLTNGLLDRLVWPRRLPSVDGLRDPSTARKTAKAIYPLLLRGADWKPGRNRPGGKRSRPTLVPILNAPVPGRGRPPRHPAELLLLMRLDAIYWKATGKKPPRDAHSQKPGPFPRFVEAVFKLAGETHVDVCELIRERAKCADEAKKRRKQASWARP